MALHRSALIGFGNSTGISTVADSAFPQARNSGSPASTNVASFVSVTCPTVETNDIIFALGRVTDTSNLTSMTAVGCTEIARVNVGSTAAIVLLWKRSASGSESGTGIQFTVSGGGGGTQTVWGVLWGVKNCITSGTPYADADVTTGGGLPGADWTSNPFTTATSSSGGMHVAFQNNATLTTLYGWTGATYLIGTEDPLITASSDNSVLANYFRCDSTGTYFTNTTTGANDAVSGSGKAFFSMELLRAL